VVEREDRRTSPPSPGKVNGKELEKYRNPLSSRRFLCSPDFPPRKFHGIPAPAPSADLFNPEAL
jgi:hypothetical protein